MWCPQCQADVAAEVDAETRRVRCASCGDEITSSATTLSDEKTRNALELLERWSSGDVLDPLGPGTPGRKEQETPQQSQHQPVPLGQIPMPEQSPSEQRPEQRPARASSGKFRFDGPHPVQGGKTGNQQNPADSVTATVGYGGFQEPPEPPSYNDHGYEQYDREPDPQPRPRTHHTHSPHVSAPAPHFNVQSAIHESQIKKGGWVSIAGQMLAYCGVATLTVGSALVLWSYFGGPDNYAPTGWLISTAGQMLLFLGVVTLVSGGMEQTSEEVKQRMRTLGDSLIRIEQATHALRGPKFGSAEYQAHQQQEHADVRQEQRPRDDNHHHDTH